MAVDGANGSRDHRPAGSAPAGAPAAASHADATLETVGFREFLPTATGIRSARLFVEQTLRKARTPDEVVAAAVLVADEFSLNAVEHAGTSFSVALELGPGTLRVAVRDDARAFPGPSPHSLGSAGGRGLTIVATTAEEWGAESLGRGKEVWADLHW
ncbi:MAG: ATP-binding protein [Acidimicrobiales bacterium]